MNLSGLRIVYICVQGGPHPAHKPWSESLLNHAGDTNVIYVPHRISHRLLPSRLIFSKRYDLAIVDGFTSLPIGWFMRKVRLCRKLAFITTSQAFTQFPTLFNLILRDVGFVIATSSLMSQTIRRMFNFNKRIAICHPIPDLSDFLKVRPSLDSQKICFVGSLMYYKGADFLPKIITKVRMKLKDTELFVIGSGRLNKVEGMKVLGFVPHNERLLLLSKCSVYVHPARFECFGVSVIEAMAAGLIPIVTTMTGSKDIVKEVSPNLIVPVNVDVIAKKVVEVLSMSHRERGKLSEKAKKTALKYAQNAGKTFVQALNSLVCN